MGTRRRIMRVACALALLSTAGCSPNGCPTPASPSGFNAYQTQAGTPCWAPSPANETDPLRYWTTNFGTVTDLAASGIEEWSPGYDGNPHNGTLSIDAADVHSGGKSIRDGGAVDDQRMLQMVFKLDQLTSHPDVMDLSDKTLCVEAYVPKGSPIGIMTIELNPPEGTVLAVRANAIVQPDGWYTYEVDVQQALALHVWDYADWMHSGLSTPAQAADAARRVRTVKITVQRAGVGTPSDTYFLIDRLGWQPSDPIPAYDPSQASLRKYADARGIRVGSMVGLDELGDPRFMRTLLRQFDFEDSQQLIFWPDQEQWIAGLVNDGGYDRFLQNVAYRVGAPTARYLIYGQLPPYLKNIDIKAAQAIMEEYVRTLVGSRGAETSIWFLFNELLDYDVEPSHPAPSGLGLKNQIRTPQDWEHNYSPFSVDDSDVSLIEDAFRVARAADPSARLFLNESNAVEPGQNRTNALLKLVDRLLKDGTPLDGVGLQAHIIIGPDGKPYCDWNVPCTFDSMHGLSGVAQTVDAFHAVGQHYGVNLQVVFSEVDVAINHSDLDTATPADRQAALTQRLETQAEVYRSLMHITLTHSFMPYFIMQSWADADSWTILDPYGNGKTLAWPGIYDADYRPKPAYYALIEELAGSPLPGALFKTGPAQSSHLSGQSASLSWTPAWGATSYEYCYDTVNDGQCQGSWISTGAHTSSQVEGLTPGATYYWQVRAVKDANRRPADDGAWWSFTAFNNAVPASTAPVFE